VLPYLAMLAVPSSLALTGARRTGFLLLVVGLLYWLMVGFRFQIGMDWNNYIVIYNWKKTYSLGELLVDREPGYGLLTWIAAKSGGGIVLINAVSGLIFCWGLLSVARRCPEPWIAIVIATPLLVVGFAMSAVRQAIAEGIIAYLFATWEQRGTLSRMGFVVLASLFHFSAFFVLIFVALASRAQPTLKVAGTIVIGLLVLATLRLAPESMDAYSRLYVGMESKLNAPGAIVEVGVVAIAGALYLLNHDRWCASMVGSPLIRNLAWASLALLPVIFISSVGAYRFVLYLWPMAMYVYAGYPRLIQAATGRAFYRVGIVVASFAMLIGWLELANNSLPWWPYKNWLLEPQGVSLFSRKPFKW